MLKQDTFFVLLCKLIKPLTRYCPFDRPKWANHPLMRFPDQARVNAHIANTIETVSANVTDNVTDNV